MSGNCRSPVPSRPGNRGTPLRRATSRSRDPAYQRSGAIAAASTRRRPTTFRSTNRRNRRCTRPVGTPAPTCARARCWMRPYATPLGHTASQARHCRHRSQCRAIAGVSSLLPSSTSFAKWIRPLGDSTSSPVTRYVGQLLRHSPQCTQRLRSSLEGASAGSGHRASDPTDEPSPVEPALRVVHRLYLSHEHDRCRRLSPRVEQRFVAVRHPLHHD